jgi:hypothetical protein
VWLRQRQRRPRIEIDSVPLRDVGLADDGGDGQARDDPRVRALGDHHLVEWHWHARGRAKHQALFARVEAEEVAAGTADARAELRDQVGCCGGHVGSFRERGEQPVVRAFADQRRHRRRVRVRQ